MPIRVKNRPPPPQRDFSPASAGLRAGPLEWELPAIGPEDAFKDVVLKLSVFFADVIELPSSFEQLRTTSAGEPLRTLVDHLGRTCTNPAIVNALLALRWHYSAENEHRGISEARANACEIVAWRFLTRQSERDAVDFCLFEIPGKEALDVDPVVPTPFGSIEEETDERSPLLAGPGGGYNGYLSANRRVEIKQAIPKLTLSATSAIEDPRNGINERTSALKDLNALEIAVIADAKRFLSQHIVQKIITSLWHGDIVFWDRVSSDATRKPRYYNYRTFDPYSRLRVPKYLKAWEVAFFVAFLALYYTVVLKRSFDSIPLIEVIFYFWLVAFAWDEFQEWVDAGIFYMTDIWNLFDLSMISIGVIFAILRVIGISLGDNRITDMAFDILSLEALLVIPRICSFLSLSPYWGTLIPCLKEMGKDFIKFMILVIIVYTGFLTTFTLVARDRFTFGTMSWNVTKIFYGNTGIGFDIMNDIDKNFGPPLVIIFITLSSILLTGSLTGMLSNSFGRVMAHAREEYLYVYSVYVLEAATSSRLTHFFPPLNLVSLIFFRPFIILFPKDDRFRTGRVLALKLTHFPIVGLISAYEWAGRKIKKHKEEKEEWAGFSSSGRTRSGSEAPNRRPNMRSRAGKNMSSMHGRRLSDQLSPEGRLRPSSNRGIWEGSEDEAGDSGPTNAELLSRIERLTEIVMAMHEQQKQRSEAVSPQP